MLVHCTVSSNPSNWVQGDRVGNLQCLIHLGKSATIQESNHDSGVCKEHYA